MGNKRFAGKGRWIGFLCCAGLPLMAMGLGILLLVKGVILSIAFLIPHFLIPAIAVGALALCIFRGRKVSRKIGLAAVIVALFLILFFFSSLFTEYTQVRRTQGAEAKEQYAAVQSENALLPEFSEIGQPIDIEYVNVFSSVVIFEVETDYLICSYAPDEYECQKAKLEETYVFQTEPVTDTHSTYEPTVVIDGYHFRMLSIDQYDEVLTYPKEVVLIGYSDKAKGIVYVAFEGWDLDYIASLEDLLADECGWGYVR